MCKCNGMKPKSANTNKAGGASKNEDLKKAFEDVMQSFREMKVSVK